MTCWCRSWQCGERLQTYQFVRIVRIVRGHCYWLVCEHYACCPFLCPLAWAWLFQRVFQVLKRMDQRGGQLRLSLLGYCSVRIDYTQGTPSFFVAQFSGLSAIRAEKAAYQVRKPQNHNYLAATTETNLQPLDKSTVTAPQRQAARSMQIDMQAARRHREIHSSSVLNSCRTGPSRSKKLQS